MVQVVEDVENDYMLLSDLSQSINKDRSLISHSVISSQSSRGSPNPSLKRTSQAISNEFQPTLSIRSCNKLASMAIRLIITGYDIKDDRHLQGITIEQSSSEPDKSLSRVVPRIFSPGFNETMGENARFLPTISHAMSSWIRNVQSPSLLKKLSALANLQTSPGTEQRQDFGQQGSPQRLAAVVQARLWGMMQRKLYDPAAVKKLRHQPLSEWGEISTNDEGLLGSNVYEEDETEVGDLLDGDMELSENTELLDEDDFDDLFAEQEKGGNDSLLNFREDSDITRGKLEGEVEMETDEMLLGKCYESTPEDEVLLLEDDKDNMLL